jgi:hypothetical protein
MEVINHREALVKVMKRIKKAVQLSTMTYLIQILDNLSSNPKLEEVLEISHVRIPKSNQ